MRALAAALLSMLAAAPTLAAAGERTPLSFSDLPGWAEDDHAAALAAWRRTCRPSAACRVARRASEPGAARRFFETWFRPEQVSASGFLTGYFEPEVSGSHTPTPDYPTPLLARPRGLVMKPETTPKGWPEGLAAARRIGAGYEAMPDRAAIEAGALGRDARALLHVHPVDAFTIQVQGSGRVRLAGGRVVRVGYDGKNGHPYTPIARVLAVREGVAPAQMTADRLWAWLRAHPAEAPEIMRANRSFVFFRPMRTDARLGPVGAAGVPLSDGRSLAVDHRAWRYGTPVWLEGELPTPEGGRTPLRRLTVAQDTGTAIVGEARGDLFLGSGVRAGAEAALLRHPVRWVVLREIASPLRGRPR